MFKFRKRNQLIIPPSIFDAVKANPDCMYVAPRFIAVYHSGTDTVIVIPHDNPNITNEQADELLNKRLEQYNQKIKNV